MFILLFYVLLLNITIIIYGFSLLAAAKACCDANKYDWFINYIFFFNSNKLIKIKTISLIFVNIQKNSERNIYIFNM